MGEDIENVSSTNDRKNRVDLSMQKAVGYKAINVLAYGADPTGIDDSYDNIMDAVAAAQAIDPALVDLTNPGIELFFPPGAYQLTQRLLFGDTGNVSIGIRGAGKRSTTIFGAVDDYLIDHPEGALEGIYSVSNMSIYNFSGAPQSGALRLHCENALAQNLMVQGFTGIDNSAVAYHSLITNCIARYTSGNEIPGSIGFIASQSSITACRAQGYDTGFLYLGTCGECLNCSCEVSNLGINIGMAAPTVVMGYITSGSPDVLTVVSVLKSSSTSGISGITTGAYKNGAYCGPFSTVFGPALSGSIAGGTYVASLGTGTGQPGDGFMGTYILNTSGQSFGSSGTPVAIGISGIPYASTGFKMSGWQTERCSTGILVTSLNAGSIDCATVTPGGDRRGPPQKVVAASWSSAGGGKVIITTRTNAIASTNYDTPFEVSFSNFEGGPAIINNVDGTMTHTGTKINASSFSIPLTPDPGAFGSMNDESWQTPMQYGMQIRFSDDSTYSNLALGADAEQAQCDLSFFNVGSLQSCSFRNIRCTWIMPNSLSKSSARFYGCSGPGFDPTMAYADLPGMGSNQNQSPVLNEFWTINNGQRSSGTGSGTVAVPGSIVSAGGSQKLVVSWTGTGTVYMCVAALT